MNQGAAPKRDVVVIAASAGGVDALKTIAGALPAGFPAALFIVQHVGSHPSVLPEILSRAGVLPAAHGEDGENFAPGRLYVAPPDRHMTLDGDRIRLDRGPKVHHTRPAADPLFRSAAEAFGRRVIGIVLTGGDSDGAQGLRAIDARGGIAIVQDPDDAHAPQMPANAIRDDHPDYCVPVRAIGPLLVRLVNGAER